MTNTGTLHRRTNITTQHCNLIRACPLRIAVAYHIRNVEAMTVVSLMNIHGLHYMDLTHVSNCKQVLILLLKTHAPKVTSIFWYNSKFKLCVISNMCTIQTTLNVLDNLGITIMQKIVTVALYDLENLDSDCQEVDSRL